MPTYRTGTGGGQSAGMEKELDAAQPALRICQGCFEPIPENPKHHSEGWGRRVRQRSVFHGPECKKLWQAAEAKAIANGRYAAKQKTGRRRIDPTTCERDYTDAETTLIKAMDRYKRENKRPFPTYSEVLQVIVSLGYRKCEEATALPGVEAGIAVRGRAEGEGDETGDGT